jgi:[acyl-carrier-protein] S-malonyltransferase
MQEPAMADMLGRTTMERTWLERAVGSDVSRALERGGSQLERTDVLQPALVAVCLAVTARLFEAGVRPDVVAGHSVGEIPALAAAGAMSSEEAIGIAAVRGRLMAREAASNPGGMLALVQAGRDTAEAAIAVGAPHGVVGLAVVNAPDQWVLSGEDPALSVVASQFSSIRLRVSGAWHSNLMAGALPELLAELEALHLRPPRATFVANRTGQPTGDSSDLAEILAEQLVRPVQWAESVATLERLEVTDIVTVGPGRTLRSLIRKTLGSRVRIHATDADLEQTIGRLKGSPS